ncbi:DUF1592 domain-containing protein [Nannocystis radixulma]|uniref:DUF1592 domain-containing protein n=1 Tax=Nannocystis radixulma TaxID=2995305 RepID=A0ABT5BPZ6_9BACT|nr:DUF1592 domain-containing protein [Nannocystis radixulma]MDC0675067.1 DUF1592 domain-containing protein [Nannocystis radixulma]
MVRLPRLGIAGALILLGSACQDDNPATDSDQPASSTADTGGSDGPTGTGAPTSTGGESDTDGDPGDPFAPAEPVLPRLTVSQYRNAIEHLLGPGLPGTPLEPDTNPYLFYNIGATSTFISELGVQQYEEAADHLSRAVFDDPARREALVGCVPATPGDACVQGFLGTFGRRAYRRPFTAEELTRWTDVANQLSQGDAWRGLQFAVAGILQSPHFLYRVELGEPDPGDPTRLRFTGWEMATRVSFLLWNSPPDDLLLDAAGNGDLYTDAGLLAEAERLLDDPRARVAMQEFFAQYLDLARLDHVTRDPARWPMFSPTMTRSMRTEVQLLVDDLIHRSDSDIRQLFSTRHTFVNAELAKLYDVAAEGASPITFVPVDLPADGPRAGILTLGAFLTMNAHETITSPTNRGKYLRERVLCQIIPPPPGDVDTDLGDDENMDAQTVREKLEQHQNDPVCAGCHSIIDPPGFLFEHFDSIGAYRTLDNGYPIDATGNLDNIPLDGARDLAEALKTDPRVGRCIVNQLYRHATGRLAETSEQPALEALEQRFIKADHRFKQLLLDLVVSEAFRTVAEETDA